MRRELTFEELEDTNGLLGIRKPKKNRQINSQRKMSHWEDLYSMLTVNNCNIVVSIITFTSFLSVVSSFPSALYKCFNYVHTSLHALGPTNKEKTISVWNGYIYCTANPKDSMLYQFSTSSDMHLYRIKNVPILMLLMNTLYLMITYF